MRFLLIFLFSFLQAAFNIGSTETYEILNKDGGDKLFTQVANKDFQVLVKRENSSDDKDILFKLRNVKNKKQLVGFFKDFKFLQLKKENTPTINGFDKALETLLTNLDEWEVVRDYIAIYAINKFRSTKHKKGE